MSKKRRQYSVRFKFQMALEALKRLKTICQLAAVHRAHRNQINIVDALFSYEKFDFLATIVIYYLRGSQR